MRFAPIVVFAFNRPAHFAQTLEALSANSGADQSDLYLYLDGPRRDSDLDAVTRVRQVARDITGFRSVTLIERAENYGLARNIIDGVSAICREHGRVIALEDDLLTSPHFLSYMNQGLDLYKDDSRVASIHGYVYPVKTRLPETFFMRGADCWGWATWDRAWHLFESDGAQLLRRIRGQRLSRSFNHNHSYDYVAMLEDQVAGRNHSWAIRWHASAFLANRFTLYPGQSLVVNIGNDGSGTHCSITNTHNVTLAKSRARVVPIPVEQSEVGAQAFEAFFKTEKRVTARRRLKMAGQQWRQGWKDKLTTIRRARRLAKSARKERLRIEGPYTDWGAARQASIGYDSAQILGKVLRATQAVQLGAATAERDSVVLDEQTYVWPLMAMALLTKARSQDDRLSILDFGGSLGSSYFQHRTLFKGFANFRWGVVEQHHFVARGRDVIADNVLSFHDTIADCVAAIRPNVVLLSSVLQYLENPAAILAEVATCGAEVIVVDRTPVSDEASNVIGVQHVPKEIYEASYPIWIFSKTFIIEALGEGWRELSQFDALDNITSPWNAVWKGAIYVRR